MDLLHSRDSVPVVELWELVSAIRTEVSSPFGHCLCYLAAFVNETSVQRQKKIVIAVSWKLARFFQDTDPSFVWLLTSDLDSALQAHRHCRTDSLLSSVHVSASSNRQRFSPYARPLSSRSNFRDTRPTSTGFLPALS